MNEEAGGKVASFNSVRLTRIESPVELFFLTAVDRTLLAFVVVVADLLLTLTEDPAKVCLLFVVLSSPFFVTRAGMTRRWSFRARGRLCPLLLVLDISDSVVGSSSRNSNEELAVEVDVLRIRDWEVEDVLEKLKLDALDSKSVML